MTDGPPPGWFPDPVEGHGERYWDGQRWTDDRRSPLPVLHEHSTPPRSDVPASSEPVLVQVGELACTEHWLLTPGGTVPLRRMQFMVRENVVVQRRIPPYAIVLAVLFFLACLLGLLFLLIQEDVVSGSVEVTATGPDGFSFHTSMPVSRPGDVVAARERVDYCRRLVAALG